MIKNDFNRLRCPRCKRYYMDKDRVFLDEMNTVLHQRCYTLNALRIKGQGTYKQIIEGYDFFEEMI